MGLSVRALGFGSSRSPLGPAGPRASANRVVYQHENVAEWYANGPLGLEQGFTVRRRPTGAAAGPLTLSLALSGNAHASLASGGHGIALSRTGQPSLRYTGLSASDSKGRPLRSWLELRGAELLLRVDARGARYPLRIDPFVQQKEKLTGSGELGEGLFGVSVALSSDGNTALIGGPNDAQKLETEGEVTEKSKIVKGLLSTTGVFAGSEVSGTQILAGTTVVRVINTKEVELSAAVEGEGSSTVKEKLIFTTDVGATWTFTRSSEKWTEQAKLAVTSGEVGNALLSAMGKHRTPRQRPGFSTRRNLAGHRRRAHQCSWRRHLLRKCRLQQHFV